MEQEGLVKSIKNVCEEKGVSIRTLESDLGFSPGLISRWARMNPSISKIVAVADYLGVSLDELVGRKEEKQKISFIEKLTDDTKNKKLLWKPLGYQKDTLYFLKFLIESMESNRVYGCCEYDEAYFLVKGCVADDGKIEDLNSYIVPNQESAPVPQDVDEEDILPLFEEIQQDITWKYDIDAAERVKERFLKDEGR